MGIKPGFGVVLCECWVSMEKKFPSASFGIGISPLHGSNWKSQEKVISEIGEKFLKSLKNQSNKKMEMGFVLVPGILGSRDELCHQRHRMGAVGIPNWGQAGIMESWNGWVGIP